MSTTPINLTAHTLALLRDRPRSTTLDQVAAGAGVTKSWLQAWICGQISTPSADKVQAIYEFLTKKPLLPNEEI